MRNKILKIMILFVLMTNVGTLSVKANDFPNYELMETFEIVMPAYHNETVALTENVDISLFDISDAYLEFAYYTKGLAVSFLLNTVDIVMIYQRLSFQNDSTLLSFAAIKFADGFGVAGSIIIDKDHFSIVTTKELFNPNDFNITILLDIGIVHDFYKDQSSLLYFLFSITSIGFIAVTTIFIAKKGKKIIDKMQIKSNESGENNGHQ